MKPIAQQFVDDVSKVIDKYRDEGITKTCFANFH